MTSQISLNKLMKQLFSHKVWLLALSAIVQFLMGPAAYLFMLDSRLNSSNYGTNVTIEKIHLTATNMLRSTFIPLQMVIAVVGAFLVALFGFDYLFSKRMVDLHHSAPVKRGKLFKAIYLNGLLTWAIPAIISDIVVLIILLSRTGSMAYFAPSFALICKMFGYSLLAFIVVFNVALVAVMLSGNIFNAIVNFITLGSAVSLMYCVILMCFASYFDTFYSATIGYDKLAWLSPIPAPFYLYSSTISEIADLSFATMLILNILLALVNLFVAYRLYQNRRSELAERGTVNKYFVNVSRVLITVFAGLFGSWMFSELASSSSRLGWAIFGSIIVSVITFCILNITYANNFKAILTHKIQLIVVSLASMVLFLTMYFDWIGYDTYLPAKNSVKSVSIQFYSFSDDGSRINLDDGSYTWDYSTFVEIEDKDVAYEVLRQSTTPTDSGTRFALEVTTKLGYTYTRQYKISTQNMASLSSVLESDDYKEAFYPASIGSLKTPDRLSAYTHGFGNEIVLKNDADIERIIDAYAKDFNENYKLENLMSFISIVEIDFNYYIKPDYDDQIRLTRYVSLEVPWYYENTLSVLREMGLEIYNKEDLDFSTLQLDEDLLPEVAQKLSSLDLQNNENIYLGSYYEDANFTDNPYDRFDRIGHIETSDIWVDVYIDTPAIFGENLDIYKEYVNFDPEYYDYPIESNVEYIVD